MAAKEQRRTSSAPLTATNLTDYEILVPKEGFEPTRPCGHYALNVARLPFRHFGTSSYQWSVFSSQSDRTLTENRLPITDNV